MANIPLQSITFPDLLNIYNVPTMEGIGKSIFPELIAGGLVDLDSYVEDSDPYLFAAMPQGAGKVLTDELVGAKVAWNQLAPAITSSKWNGNSAFGTSTFDTDKITYTITSKNGSQAVYCGYSVGGIPLVKGHKYFLSFYVTSSQALQDQLFRAQAMDSQWIMLGSAQANQRKYISAVFESTKETGGNSYFGIFPAVSAGLDVGATFSVEKISVIDLTLMLGSTTADHIYSLEQVTAGAGVAFFTKYFGNGYRPYDAGSLQGALVSGHKTVGVNQWDEELESNWINTDTGQPQVNSDYLRTKNYISVFPSTSYYYKAPTATQYARLYFYDADKSFISYAGTSQYLNNVFTTPSNAYYMKFVLTVGTYGTTYKNDICINISNADINGKYFPYEEHTYEIEPEDLNGVFVLDNGELKADGDVRRADGSKAVRYGEVDLGELNWSYYTGGTNPIFQATVSDMVNNLTNGTKPKIVCPKYNVAPVSARSTFSENEDNSISIINGNNIVLVRNTSYTDADVFKTAMSGRKLVYPLATPTEDTAEPFEEYQACNPYGTEQYILDDSQIVPIPAGHNTKYFEDPLANIMARLDALENA